MLEVIVIAEGQTEEQFIKRVVAPTLHPLRLFLKPLLLQTSRLGKGGAVSFDRLQRNARNALRQSPHAVLSTFLDLYGLDPSFPQFGEAKQLADPYARVQRLESALHEAIVQHVGCMASRFIPHIQPHEFEGLLFSDVQALSETEPGWSSHTTWMTEVRASFDTPEHINDGYETKPSKRLEDHLRPRYRKTRHGPLAASRIGLPAMEAECPHFHAWMQSLRALAAA